MLNRLTVKGRMYIINAAILVLFVTMVAFFAVRNSNGVKDLGLQKTGEVMLEDQKARIQLASHAAALMAEAAIAGVTDEDRQKQSSAVLVDKIIYEKDRSGYLLRLRGDRQCRLSGKEGKLSEKIWADWRTKTV
jgi:methyl-accepting chemotaxis protein